MLRTLLADRDGGPSSVCVGAMRGPSINCNTASTAPSWSRMRFRCDVLQWSGQRYSYCRWRARGRIAIPPCRGALWVAGPYYGLSFRFEDPTCTKSGYSKRYRLDESFCVVGQTVSFSE
ncbi:hypothetical protein EVAR_38346_1 [Eumeta japonica]|uniref:Uncharacterized protein n=1 Tax=Eumeta variegata TaxID=151549 RepID=A0A4C1XWB2_EUMVA|nr:hypothetical protein EVAR_38346_1 [Eumeta japonica]